MSEADQREAQARVAARYREAARKAGGEISQGDALARVQQAQRVNDAKRDDNNR